LETCALLQVCNICYYLLPLSWSSYLRMPSIPIENLPMSIHSSTSVFNSFMTAILWLSYYVSFASGNPSHVVRPIPIIFLIFRYIPPSFNSSRILSLYFVFDFVRSHPLAIWNPLYVLGIQFVVYVTATLCCYRLRISYYSSNTGVYFNVWQI
jgi:hypothetical protein